MPSNELFGSMFTTPAMREVVSAEGWLRRMLQVEAALAHACADTGLLTRERAEAIEAACDPARYDAAAIGAEATRSSTPVVPLVEAVRREVGPEHAGAVHLEATSQDVIDTAMMLIARDGIDLLLPDLDRAAAACAALAREHRETPMLARTLLQPALPTVFGLKAANWLQGLLDARESLCRARGRLALQFGGPAGTLAFLGVGSPTVATLLARRLGLAEAGVPWHTSRGRVVELGAALGETAGAAGKVALDIVLMAQGEVAEVAEADGGRSSAMAHKRNPARSVAAVACARRTPGLVSTLFASMLQEHERSAGGWQAEWEPVCELMELAAACTSHIAVALEGLQVDTEAMRRNLEASGVPPDDAPGAAGVFVNRVLTRYREATGA